MNCQNNFNTYEGLAQSFVTTGHHMCLCLRVLGVVYRDRIPHHEWFIEQLSQDLSSVFGFYTTHFPLSTSLLSSALV
ncbi:hypothetical protein Hypma_011369 [Hypsizygus marmoreus]|uniref:Uncharacterized protein n=1 Tax=Hypsizygus marmoreus TaxID=39966 RepID=A0A369JR26_HYPMA|nr:hypothetical protein Hypma_011369 [Hypsizygus marmoreus]